jgi:hypothetical protein
MSSSFSFSRFGKLVTKQFFENSRLYTFSVLALFGLLALIFAFWIAGASPRFQEEQTWIIFIFGLFIAGTIFASMAFNMLDGKDKGICWLGLPATHLEKLVCTIFYTTVLFTVAYCICFFIVKGIAVAFILEFIKDKPNASYTKVTDYNRGFMEVLPYLSYAYLAVQAFYLLGAVYFSKYTYVVTTVVGAIIIFAFGYYISQIRHGMFTGMSYEITSVKRYTSPIAGTYQLYSLSSTVNDILAFIVKYAWAPLFWIITWYRLKEKEV